MSAITTHIVDSTSGQPGSGIPVMLERKTHASGWEKLAEGMTNLDGRVNDLLLPAEVLLAGHYRLYLDVGPYYLLKNIECFFPQIVVGFAVRDPLQHYHIPLLLNPHGYTVYRGF